MNPLGPRFLSLRLLSITSASLLALAAPRLVPQCDEEPWVPSLGDLEKAIPRPREPQTEKRAPWARLADDKLRFAAEALKLNSKQAMLLIVALCELSRNRVHWSRKPDETWGKFLHSLHEIVTESRARPMLPAEAWYEVARWYLSS